MNYLYATSGAWGVGTGIWLDAIFGITNPGGAVVMPIVFGAGAPIAAFFTDNQVGPLARGVPSSMATGLVLGAVEGIAISGVQWQHARDKQQDWTFRTQTSVTWVCATGGGLAGLALGELTSPDSRNLALVGSGAGWGTLSGAMLGIAASGRDWKDGASIAGLVGYNVGILGTGALGLVHTPSWDSQKYMWFGYAGGALAGSLVFPFYALTPDADPKTGFIGPALGSLAGAAVAAALTFDWQDPAETRGKIFEPPVQVSIAPPPRLSQAPSETPGGLMLTGSGTF